MIPCTVALLILGTCLQVAMQASVQPSVSATQAAPPDDAQIRARLLEHFHRESGWVKLHAAEAAVLTGATQPVRDALEDRPLPPDAPKGFRIGIWRTLARATSDRQRQRYVDQIRAVALDESAADRLWAVESLAKLGVRPDEPLRASMRSYLQTAPAMDRPMILWLLAPDQPDATRRQLVEALSDTDKITLLRAGFVLRNLGGLSAEQWQLLRAAADDASRDPLARTYLLSAAYALAPTDAERRVARQRLVDFARSAATPQRYELAAVLGDHGSAEDLPLLADLLDSSEPDAQISALLAIARLRERTRSGG